MKYENLEDEEKLNSMSLDSLRQWVDVLYKKMKKIQHSEMRHKHDSVFWKRKFQDVASDDVIVTACNEIDKSRESLQ